MLKKKTLGIFMVFQVLLLVIFVVSASGPASAQTPIKIMPLGDSITGSPGCWRAILWNRLQTTGFTNIDFVGTLPPQGCGVSYDGDNEGHGGFLATNIANQNQLPPWLSATNPNIVMMHLGTNDVWSNIPPATILAAFSTLVDQMRANNPNVKILVAQIIPVNPPSCSECAQRTINFNAAIPAWASSKSTSQSPIIVVDQWTGFNTATDTGDGVHPNDAGIQKISDKWYPALSALLSGSPVSTATRTSTPILVNTNTATRTFTAGPTATRTRTPTGTGTGPITPFVTSTRTPTPSNTVCPAVTGTVRQGSSTGPGLSGVLLTGTAPGFPSITGTTDSTGRYTLGGCSRAGMVVTAQLAGFTFAPAQQTTNGMPLDFVGTANGMATNTPTRTPTIGLPTNTPTTPPTGGSCSPVTSTITTIPFTFDGAGTFCWQASSLGGFINSWNTNSVSVNGQNVTNIWVGSGSYPAKVNGFYYVSYNSGVAWGHFEARP